MPEPGQRVSKYVLVLLVFAGLASGALAFKHILGEARAVVSGAGLRVLGQLPEFTLMRETSQPLTRSSLLGQIWVADFVFTRCAGPCPRMTRRMAQLQQELADLPGVRLVSFSVDPEYDTPRVLREYAQAFGADSDRW